MLTNKSPALSVSNLINELQSQGQYTFRTEEIAFRLKRTDLALKKALHRLELKGRLIVPKRGFYVIVPPEYLKTGAPPPSWYIHQLMHYEERPYYVGLLSAASFHGASHQAVQEFQVMTNYPPLKPIAVGRTSIKFFTKKNIERSLTEKIKTHTGYMDVSTVEVTALDLMKYYYAAGYINHVATVLNEIKEKFDPIKFREALKKENGVAHVQRLGVLLMHINANEKILNVLSGWLKTERAYPILLNPKLKEPPEKTKKNQRWQVVINDKIEVDL